jgi:hypothetical protein
MYYYIIYLFICRNLQNGNDLGVFEGGFIRKTLYFNYLGRFRMAFLGKKVGRF